LLQAQRGELDAFVELVREHQRPLHRLCFALQLDPDRARHLTLECMRLAWREVDSLPIGRPFFPYLVRSVRNLALAHARQDPLHNYRVGATRPSGAPWAEGTSNPALAAEEQRLMAAYAGLGVDDRLLLALRLGEGLSLVELSEVLELSASSVRRRLAALRGRLDQAAMGEAA
jgi:RNA polymerase sigma-70 factor (ECF subfamily)